MFTALLVDTPSTWKVLPTPAHSPPLFGAGGALILVSFLAILWLWARRHAMLRGSARTAADLQLVGYTFLFIAMWYLCGDLSRPYQRALADLPLGSPVPTIAY